MAWAGAAPDAAKMHTTPASPPAEHAALQPPGQAERPAQPAGGGQGRPGRPGSTPAPWSRRAARA